ncbi:MAG: hypothetical protein R2708_03215 [Vicinamibacterales bacterium]
MFDDSLEGPRRIADHSSISGRIRHLRRGRHQRRAAIGLTLKQRADARPGQQRHVAGQQQHAAYCPFQHAAGLQQRVSRAQLRLLDNEADVRCGSGGFNLSGAVTQHDRNRSGPQRAGQPQHPLEQWQPGGSVEHLRLRGLHPRPLAGRQDHDVQRLVGHK